MSKFLNQVSGLEIHIYIYVYVISVYHPVIYLRGQQTFSEKNEINIFGLGGHMVSLVTTQFCCCAKK